MFKWLSSLFGKKTASVDDDPIVILPPKPLYRGYIEDEHDQMENSMPVIPNLSQREAVDAQNLMIDTGNGLVPVNSSQIQHMLNRPGVPEGLPGISVPTKKQPQAMRQNMQPQQYQQPPQHGYQPMPQPAFQQGYPQQGYPQQNWAPQGPPQQEYWQQPPQGYDNHGNVMPPQQAVPVPQQQVRQVARKPYPFYEQYTMDNEYHLEIDLPGIDEHTLSIEYADSIVSISGYRENAIGKISRSKKKKEEQPQEHQCTIPAHLLGKFTFDFTFKKMVDESMISADYTNGVLHVTLPHRVKGEKVKIGLKKQSDV